MEENVVWMYWSDCDDRGRPPYIDACLESVRRNSECRIVLCDETTAQELLPDLPSCFGELSAPHQSDLFRVGILAANGGMYLDADTVVLRSLAPLFKLLEEYEFVAADWKPEHRIPEQWSPLGVGVLGPARPGLPFLSTAYERQVRCVERHSRALSEGRRYPFKWTALLYDILVPCFEEQRPATHLRDGAATWFSLVGGPVWEGGNLRSPLRSMHELEGHLPDSELFTLSNMLLPDDVKYAPLDVLKRQGTILSYLLEVAGIDD